MSENLLVEAERMRLHPGIIFVEGATGPRARIAGTGIEVFEVIKNYHLAHHDLEELAQGYEWLQPKQLRAAIAYYEQFPDEINTRLEEEEALLTPTSEQNPGQPRSNKR